MIITDREIANVLNDIIHERIQRHKASDWALKLIEAQDEDILEYFPSKSEEKIWEAILYIQGIDMESSPGIYLHQDSDIESYLKEFKA